VTESEIKLRMPSPEAAREALARLGARLARARHFEDNVLWDDPQASLGAAGKVVRLRRAEGTAVLTYKGPRRIVEGIKSREERETTLSDPEALERVLSSLGLQPRFRYQKYRETYAWDEVEIVVDETPVGTFLEIEGDLAAIHKAAQALGRTPADYLTDSYPALFFAAGGTGDMVFP